MEFDAQADLIQIRQYESKDANATLAVFVAAVTETAARDYSPEQIGAWTRSAQGDVLEWDRSRRKLNTYVAVIDGNIAGFSDVSADGHIEMMFVSPRYGRRGVGGRLMSFLEGRALGAGASQLSADVSVTARPFFQAHGFVVHDEQHPVTAGVAMTNFGMVKELRRDR